MSETMRGVEIHDGATTSGGLNFDLVAILTALGESVQSSMWRCRNLSYTSRDEEDIPLFDEASQQKRVLSHTELLRATERLLQMIDGDFEATRPGDNGPWLRVRAVDSSWWEVYSTDPNALHAIRARFTDVHDIGEVPQN